MASSAIERTDGEAINEVARNCGSLAIECSDVAGYVAGVSERTLRAAFHDVVGVSPKRYALMQRLQAAHQALQQADPHTTTVTDVAMTFGFFELGRFAGRYRHTFGEVPSQTLRQPLGDQAHQPERAA